MDKKLSRQIGYKRPTTIKLEGKPVGTLSVKKRTDAIAPTKVVAEVISEKKKKEGPTAAQVVAWIKAHPLFKWAALCKLVGMDRSNFSKVLRSETPLLKKEVVDSIAAILRDYGFEN